MNHAWYHSIFRGGTKTNGPTQEPSILISKLYLELEGVSKEAKDDALSFNNGVVQLQRWHDWSSRSHGAESYIP
ncbi:hypothetical protein EYC80_003310 [Monilinia laxa]|uniref:Uncharacterized protein n=1 Tax=Monilinia laxa TaxID=61186 RepID=A0A5N6KDI4_MONLA|nr:hypothetical protein EYC80_003310 [Monilinia laxa]